MTDWPILSTVTFLPLVGAFLILLIRDEGEAARKNIRMIALLTTVATFIVSLFVWIGFDNSDAGFQMVEKTEWLGSGISYHMGVDGISARVIDVTNRAVKLQSGYLYHYAFAMLIGVAGLVTWMMFGSSF